MSRDSLNISGSNIQGNVIQGGNSGNVSSTVSTSGQDTSEKEIANEIQRILDHLSVAHTVPTTVEKMGIAAKAVEMIEQNVPLKSRIMNSLKAGSTAAIGQFLNHPASSFVIAALEEWNSSNK